MSKQVKFDIADSEIDGDDYFVVIEPVFLAVSIYDGPETYENDLAKFSKQQRHVLACHWYLSEVNNGGHDQFYDNSTGVVWLDAKEGFNAIGASAVAEIITESAQRLRGRPSFDREERQHQLELSKPLDDLDDKLFDFEKQVDLDAKLSDYIRKNRSKFYFCGLVTDPTAT
jgi:hypothetical protein